MNFRDFPCVCGHSGKKHGIDYITETFQKKKNKYKYTFEWYLSKSKEFGMNESCFHRYCKFDCIKFKPDNLKFLEQKWNQFQRKK